VASLFYLLLSERLKDWAQFRDLLEFCRPDLNSKLSTSKLKQLNLGKKF
jgi:hypothetical protein